MLHKSPHSMITAHIMFPTQLTKLEGLAGSMHIYSALHTQCLSMIWIMPAEHWEKRLEEEIIRLSWNFLEVNLSWKCLWKLEHPGQSLSLFLSLSPALPFPLSFWRCQSHRIAVRVSCQKPRLPFTEGQEFQSECLQCRADFLAKGRV